MEENIQKPKELKIALLGDTEVGKTIIAGRYMGLEFSLDCCASIGLDKLEMKFTLKNNEDIKLILFDTAGPERFRSLALQVLKHVQGAILIFDVTRKSSFNNLNIWLEEIKNITDNLILVLFVNKVDIYYYSGKSPLICDPELSALS